MFMYLDRFCLDGYIVVGFIHSTFVFFSIIHFWLPEKLSSTNKSVKIARFFSQIIRKGKMVVEHHVKGYEEFTKLVDELETSGKTIHILFSGGKQENGESWCPYCVKAEPVVMSALEKAPEETHFIHVDVGERAYWKDLNCPSVRIHEHISCSSPRC
uniref:Thioredoxin domain-containing protein 17 n=1 Tax=Lutzomyia longipalpis TaxID=7200 RepID=A0A1B0CD68_LUTLO